jgi:PAS domain-containing protein
MNTGCLVGCNLLSDPMSSPPSNAPPTAEFLASVVEYSDDAIITKDLNGRVMTSNQGAERIFGYTATGRHRAQVA